MQQTQSKQARPKVFKPLILIQPKEQQREEGLCECLRVMFCGETEEEKRRKLVERERLERFIYREESFVPIVRE